MGSKFTSRPWVGRLYDLMQITLTLRFLISEMEKIALNFESFQRNSMRHYPHRPHYGAQHFNHQVASSAIFVSLRQMLIHLLRSVQSFPDAVSRVTHSFPSAL